MKYKIDDNQKLFKAQFNIDFNTTGGVGKQVRLTFIIALRHVKMSTSGLKILILLIFFKEILARQGELFF